MIPRIELNLIVWLEFRSLLKDQILVEPQQTTFTEISIYNALFWNPVPNIIDWYTPMDRLNDYAMIRFKQVLQTGLKMIMIDEENKLPNKRNKK